MKKLLIALAGIIVGGIITGFTIGKITSPDYDVEENVLKYIYRHIEMDEQNGQPFFRIACGGKMWFYFPITDSLETVYDSPWLVQQTPFRQKFKSMNLNMVYSIVGGGPTAIIGGTKFIDYLAPLSKNQKVAFGVIALVTTVSGFYWGYRMGYSDDLDCTTELAQRVLSDKKMWRTYVSYRMKTPVIGVTPSFQNFARDADK